jgi:hypothetical protein
MSAPEDDVMEEWKIGDVEPVLHGLKAEIAILGHLINTPDEVESSTWARVEDALIASHARLQEIWHGAWCFQIAERDAAAAALAAAKAERAAPGSVYDAKQARSAWRLLRSAAEVTLERCAEVEAAFPTQPGPADAALLAACQAYLVEHRIVEDYDNGRSDLDEAGITPPMQRQRVALDRVTATRALTTAGLRAKAEVACLAMDQLKDFDIPWKTSVARSALADVIAAAGAAS